MAPLVATDECFDPSYDPHTNSTRVTVPPAQITIVDLFEELQNLSNSPHFLTSVEMIF
jgi:hypothetical protein